MEQTETLIQTFIDTNNRRRCLACGLNLNQLPVLDHQQKSHIFWVGLSSVLIAENEVKKPLSPHTRSGALIKSIEEPFKNEISFYKTNVVKCLPLQNEKIRYPVKHEMEKCYPNLEFEIEELKPSIIFLLGKQVANFVLGKHAIKVESLSEEFVYEKFKINDILYVPVHHPSFILVYKRKFIENYRKGISALFDEVLIPEYLEI